MQTRNHETKLNGLVVDIEQFDVNVGSGWHTYQIIRHPGGVAVLPLHDDGSVTLVSQPRPAIMKKLIEVPAGRRDSSESPEICGRRELKEETGLVADKMIDLGSIYTSPGIFDEEIHLFMAQGLIQENAEPEQYEEIETLRMPLFEALEMVNNGRICDGKSIALISRASSFLERLRDDS